MSSAITAAEPIPICSAFFGGEEFAAFAAFDRRRDRSGDDGVDAAGSVDCDGPGVTADDTKDSSLSS